MPRPGNGPCATRSPGATICSPPPDRAAFSRLAVFVGGFHARCRARRLAGRVDDDAGDALLHFLERFWSNST